MEATHPDVWFVCQEKISPPKRVPRVSLTSRRLNLDRLFTLYVPLALMLLFLLAPFYWMLITSLKPDSELYSPNGNPLLVFSPSLEHYAHLLETTQFPTWTR